MTTGEELGGAMPETQSTEPASAWAPGQSSSPWWRRVLGAVGVLLLVLLTLIGAVLIGSATWIRRTFGPISVDQMLSNLDGAGGDGGGGATVIQSAVLNAVVLPSAVVLVAILVLWLLVRARRKRGPGSAAGRRWLTAVVVLISFAVFGTGASMFGSTVGVVNYISSINSSADMGAYYHDPLSAPQADASETVEVEPDATQPKNLVLIYMESIEDTFADEDLFELNMLESIEDQTRSWTSFDGLRQYEGGGWTMAGLVGTQCGVPLRAPIGGESGDEEGQVATSGRGYLPGATCLGDVLAERGYTNVFMGGADTAFASKHAFLDGHGYSEISDINTWIDLGETEMRDDWGLSDNRLMERAKEEVTRLHEQDEPFNLTVLTLDSHDPAYLYDTCPQISETVMTSVVTCSAAQVADFVAFMRDTGVLEDTAVVMMGDHLKMISEEGSFWDELQGLADRTIFSRVWDPDGARIERRGADQLSVYPTILELLDIPLDEHRAGLGVSALTDAVPDSSTLTLTSDEYRELLHSRSTRFYGELWGESRGSVARELERQQSAD